jgi:hypothetical protein
LCENDVVYDADVEEELCPSERVTTAVPSGDDVTL